MSDIPTGLRRLVILRAGNRCEYYRLSQASQEATFHIDHIRPRSAGGRTLAGNLALACVSCSLRKEARRFAIDPITNRRVALFHPRLQRRRAHFRWDGIYLVGVTPTGRATVAALRMNRQSVLEIRHEELARGRRFDD